MSVAAQLEAFSSKRGKRPIWSKVASHTMLELSVSYLFKEFLDWLDQYQESRPPKRRIKMLVVNLVAGPIGDKEFPVTTTLRNVNLVEELAAFAKVNPEECKEGGPL